MKSAFNSLNLSSNYIYNPNKCFGQNALSGPQTCDQGRGAFADLFCSFLWGAGLCPLLSHLGPYPGLGPVSWTLAQGQGFPQSRKQWRKGLNYDQKMTRVGVNSRFGEKREEVRPFLWNSSRINCREISSTGRRLLLKGGTLVMGGALRDQGLPRWCWWWRTCLPMQGM